MRDLLAFRVLIIIGFGAIVAGALGLAGVLALESGTSTLLVAIGAVGSGIGLLRTAARSSASR